MQIVQPSSATNNFCRKIVLLLDSLQKIIIVTKLDD